jgi:hypothetical protein
MEMRSSVKLRKKRAKLAKERKVKKRETVTKLKKDKQWN